MKNKDPKIHFMEDSMKYSQCLLYLDNIRCEIETLGVCDEEIFPLKNYFF